MVGTKHPKGYRYVTLRKDGKQYSLKVHRLVAETFIPNPDNLPEVNHKNEDKSDNSVENLEWCSTQYNHEYGTRAERARISCGKPIRCKETGEEYNGARWAATALGLDSSSITKAVKNPNRTCGGYHWEYIEDDE